LCYINTTVRPSMQSSSRMIFGLTVATLLFPVTISASIYGTPEARDQRCSAGKDAI
jgi:hypothetical protein